MKKGLCVCVCARVFKRGWERARAPSFLISEQQPNSSLPAMPRLWTFPCPIPKHQPAISFTCLCVAYIYKCQNGFVSGSSNVPLALRCEPQGQRSKATRFLRNIRYFFCFPPPPPPPHICNLPQQFWQNISLGNFKFHSLTSPSHFFCLWSLQLFPAPCRFHSTVHIFHQTSTDRSFSVFSFLPQPY